MSRPPITLERTDRESVRRVESLLKANDLPYEDVRANPEQFFLARADGTRIGAGGVEPHGSTGLLRSVVVAESHRGRGYGAALCDALEDRARADEVETLYLLTTTAAAFFRRRGYEEIARESVPSAIRQTTEFADLCPETATCMRKRL
ncbi:arsenic resistance N-acetyltransferase ArsN2 [Halorussus sp. AFM4]|uniref:arsenic resistance N-acetyltransferase ArsN2 n=1 Tax=Halorussus sp. AFM4 TaxID=3421651 RepID=UPI003EB7793A